LSKDGCRTIGVCPLPAFTSCQRFRTWQLLQDKVAYLAQEQNHSSLVNAKEGGKREKTLRGKCLLPRRAMLWGLCSIISKPGRWSPSLKQLSPKDGWCDGDLLPKAPFLCLGGYASCSRGLPKEKYGSGHCISPTLQTPVPSPDACSLHTTPSLWLEMGLGTPHQKSQPQEPPSRGAD